MRVGDVAAGPRAGLVGRSVRRLRDDRGAASIFVLAIGLVLIGVALTVVTIGAARLARHQAKAAADFGALAGGPHAVEGPAVACAAAARYVEANHARMIECTVDGLEIVVRAEVRLEVYPASAQASSRAGPVTAVTGDSWRSQETG